MAIFNKGAPGARKINELKIAKREQGCFGNNFFLSKAPGFSKEE